MGEEYPVTVLGDLLGQLTSRDDRLDHEAAPLLLVRTESGPAAVAIDTVVDGRYLVVKQLGIYAPRVRGVVGASVLADGSVAPVLDVRDLLRSPTSLHIDADQIQALSEAALKAMPKVLIVDDSLSARRTLTAVVSDAGLEARTAVDGLEAIESIEKDVPDAVLLDMEMPRMNGLELAVHLRASDETCKIPLVMITSRSTNKHRDQARAAGVDDFITKPYEEAEIARKLRQLIQTA